MKIVPSSFLPETKSPELVKQEQLSKLKDASKMFERQFLQEMVKAMRGTVQKAGLVPETMGEKIFSEQLDQEYIQAWVEGGGVGFADQIYKNIVEKYFPDPLPERPPSSLISLESDKIGPDSPETDLQSSFSEEKVHESN